MKCPRCNVDPVISRRRDGSKSTCPQCGLEEIHFGRFLGEKVWGEGGKVINVEFGDVLPGVDAFLVADPDSQKVALEFTQPVQKYVMDREGVGKLIALLVQAMNMLDGKGES